DFWGLRPTGQGVDDLIVLRLLRPLRFLLRRPTAQVANLRGPVASYQTCALARMDGLVNMAQRSNNQSGFR
ncbi:MAG: hypothetical protein MUF54_06990, partial [Polyangiaceae bacterium]|nr:hypothetical protein [Polyangiaceae bacterium]